jgi:hypothetical protein
VDIVVLVKEMPFCYGLQWSSSQNVVQDYFSETAGAKCAMEFGEWARALDVLGGVCIGCCHVIHAPSQALHKADPASAIVPPVQDAEIRDTSVSRCPPRIRHYRIHSPAYHKSTPYLHQRHRPPALTE